MRKASDPLRGEFNVKREDVWNDLDAEFAEDFAIASDSNNSH